MKGSIHKYIGKRGTSWYAVVDLPPDSVTGKRRQKRVSAPTKREVEQRIAQLISASDSFGVAEAGKLTVREYLDRWLESAQSRLRPSTHRRYADLIRLHVVPQLGNVRLAKLTPLQIERLYKNKMDARLSPTTVSNLHALLHVALKQAVRWGLLNQNVTERVDRPRRSTPEIATWSVQEVAAVLEKADETDLAALWRIALLTGMRRGEILGLLWQDVDIERLVLAVRRTLSRGKGGIWELGMPKTAAGRRSISLPAPVVESLKRHRVRQLEQRVKVGPLWEDWGFVFTNKIGGPLHVNSLAAEFQKLIASADVPKIRFHDLRHTSATLLLANGENPKIVAERLGHSDVGITLNLYSHVTPDMQRNSADRLDAAIDKVAKRDEKAVS